MLRCKHLRQDRMEPFAVVSMANLPEKAGPEFHQTGWEMTLCVFCAGLMRAWLPQIASQLGGEMQQ